VLLASEEKEFELEAVIGDEAEKNVELNASFALPVDTVEVDEEDSVLS
jgi:hypothetical protein